MNKENKTGLLFDGSGKTTKDMRERKDRKLGTLLLGTEHMYQQKRMTLDVKKVPKVSGIERLELMLQFLYPLRWLRL